MPPRSRRRPISRSRRKTWSAPRPISPSTRPAGRRAQCWLRGSDAVLQACRRKLGVAVGGTSADGLFTLVEVECLGACVNAPVLQVNDDYYEDLDGPATEALIEAFAKGTPPPPGSVIGRRGSEPVGGRTTLLDPAAGDTQ